LQETERDAGNFLDAVYCLAEPAVQRLVAELALSCLVEPKTRISALRYSERLKSVRIFTVSLRQFNIYTPWTPWMLQILKHVAHFEINWNKTILFPFYFRRTHIL